MEPVCQNNFRPTCYYNNNRCFQYHHPLWRNYRPNKNRYWEHKPAKKNTKGLVQSLKDKILKPNVQNDNDIFNFVKISQNKKQNDYYCLMLRKINTLDRKIENLEDLFVSHLDHTSEEQLQLQSRGSRCSCDVMAFYDSVRSLTDLAQELKREVMFRDSDRDSDNLNADSGQLCDRIHMLEAELHTLARYLNKLKSRPSEEHPTNYFDDFIEHEIPPNEYVELKKECPCDEGSQNKNNGGSKPEKKKFKRKNRRKKRDKRTQVDDASPNSSNSLCSDDEFAQNHYQQYFTRCSGHKKIPINQSEYFFGDRECTNHFNCQQHETPRCFCRICSFEQQRIQCNGYRPKTNYMSPHRLPPLPICSCINCINNAHSGHITIHKENVRHRSQTVQVFKPYEPNTDADDSYPKQRGTSGPIDSHKIKKKSPQNLKNRTNSDLYEEHSHKRSTSAGRPYIKNGQKNHTSSGRGDTAEEMHYRYTAMTDPVPKGIERKNQLILKQNKEKNNQKQNKNKPPQKKNTVDENHESPVRNIIYYEIASKGQENIFKNGVFEKDEFFDEGKNIQNEEEEEYKQFKRKDNDSFLLNGNKDKISKYKERKSFKKNYQYEFLDFSDSESEDSFSYQEHDDTISKQKTVKSRYNAQNKHKNYHFEVFESEDDGNYSDTSFKRVGKYKVDDVHPKNLKYEFNSGDRDVFVHGKNKRKKILNDFQKEKGGNQNGSKKNSFKAENDDRSTSNSSESDSYLPHYEPQLCKDKNTFKKTSSEDLIVFLNKKLLSDPPRQDKLKEIIETLDDFDTKGCVKCIIKEKKIRVLSQDPENNKGKKKNKVIIKREIIKCSSCMNALLEEQNENIPNSKLRKSEKNEKKSTNAGKENLNEIKEYNDKISPEDVPTKMSESGRINNDILRDGLKNKTTIPIFQAELDQGNVFKNIGDIGESTQHTDSKLYVPIKKSSEFHHVGNTINININRGSLSLDATSVKLPESKKSENISLTTNLGDNNLLPEENKKDSRDSIKQNISRQSQLVGSAHTSTKNTEPESKLKVEENIKDSRDSIKQNIIRQSQLVGSTHTITKNTEPENKLKVVKEFQNDNPSINFTNISRSSKETKDNVENKPLESNGINLNLERVSNKTKGDSRNKNYESRNSKMKIMNMEFMKHRNAKPINLKMSLQNNAKPFEPLLANESKIVYIEKHDEKSPFDRAGVETATSLSKSEDSNNQLQNVSPDKNLVGSGNNEQKIVEVKVGKIELISDHEHIEVPLNSTEKKDRGYYDNGCYSRESHKKGNKYRVYPTKDSHELKPLVNSDYRSTNTSAFVMKCVPKSKYRVCSKSKTRPNIFYSGRRGSKQNHFKYPRTSFKHSKALSIKRRTSILSESSFYNVQEKQSELKYKPINYKKSMMTSDITSESSYSTVNWEKVARRLKEDNNYY